MQFLDSIRKAKRVKTFGNSMSPLLRDGDVVYFKNIRFSNIQVNDIICVQKNHKIFTHRVIYKTQKYLITRGDNNYISDGKIYPKNLIGVVSKVKRGEQILDTDTLYLLQSSIYFKETVSVKMLLVKNGINFVFPKGPLLYMYFEKAYPRRIYSDSDILISNKQIKKVKKVLTQLGYKEVDTSLSAMHRRIMSNSTKTSFFKAVNGFPVIFDIHYIINPAWTLGNLDFLYPHKLMEELTEKFIKESELVEIQGEKFPILSGPNLIVYYALHIYHHNFNATYRLDFLNMVIKKTKVDYGEMAEKILDYRLNNFIFACFAVLEKHYSTRFPKKFLDRIKPNRGVVNFIENKVLKINIFDEQNRFDAGVLRFRNRFHLSPNSIFIKSLIFLNSQVIQAILWVLIIRFRKFATSLKS
jgi:signal peptidase I